MKSFNEKSKILKEVTTMLKNRLPSIPSEYDQLTALATFLYAFRELLTNDPQMEGALAV